MGVQGPGVPGPPVKNRAGLAKSRPCAFSARHSPHWGKGKRDGPPPSPTKPGAEETRLFDNRICLSPFAPAEQESKLPLERVGPAFAGTSGRDIRCRPRRARPGTVPKAVFVAVPDLRCTTSAVFVTGHIDQLSALVLHRVRDTHAGFSPFVPAQAGTQARVNPWAPAFAGANE